MTVQEADIRKLDKTLQARMAKLSLDGVKFTINDADTVTVDNRPRWRCDYHHQAIWVDSSLEWLVKRAWLKRTTEDKRR